MPDESGPNKRMAQRVTHNVAELRRGLGQRMPVDISMTLPRLKVIASHSSDEPVTGQLVIESIENGVTVAGSITFGWEGDCRRCLNPVVGSSQAQVMEIFQVGAPDDSEDIHELENETVDLVPIVRDIVALGLPLVPLCGPDCRGPDPERYPARTVEDLANDPSTPVRDPRWAVLDDLDLN